MKRRSGLTIVKMIGFAILAAAVIGTVVMLLWNALIPELFKGPVITYWQALGLLVLSHILFHGMGHHRGHGWRHDRLSRRLEEKFAAMTPEEQEKFKAEWHRCWGWMPRESEPKQDR